MAEHAVNRTVVKLLVIVVAMFAFVFVVMVPLYDVLCDALGINGKTGERYEAVAAEVDDSRIVKVQFLARNSDGMVWHFQPESKVIRVHPGAAEQTVFQARNSTQHEMVAQAIPSVSPSRAAAYFNKTECFCFNQQTLAAGESAELPLRFIVDQDLPRDISTITLSYTLFDVTERFAVSD